MSILCSETLGGAGRQYARQPEALAAARTRMAADPITITVKP